MGTTSETVAVAYMGNHYASHNFPKREALLFDRIVIVDFDPYIDTLRYRGDSDDHQHADTLEWLIDEGIIVKRGLPRSAVDPAVTQDVLKAVETRRQFETALEEVKRLQDEADALQSQGKYIQADDVRSLAHSLFNESLPLVSAGNMLIARAAANEITLAGETNAVAILDAKILKQRFGTVTRASEVLAITINQFPVLDGVTPWEELLQFRSDSETRGRVLQLRRWMRKAAAGSESAPELAEELDHLIHEYRHYMSVQHMKYSSGVLSTAVTFVAGLVEDILKGTLKNVASSVLDVRKQKAELLASEIQAPGREISFIVRASEAFDRPR